MDSTSLFTLTHNTSQHFSYAIHDPNNPTPYISADWLYVIDDTEYLDSTPTFTLVSADNIINRNNFGKFQDHHFSPLPTSNTSSSDLNSALSSLAKRLTAKFSGIAPPMQHLAQFRKTAYGHSLNNPLPLLLSKRAYLTETTTTTNRPTTSEVTNVDDNNATSTITNTTTQTIYTFPVTTNACGRGGPVPVLVTLRWTHSRL